MKKDIRARRAGETQSAGLIRGRFKRRRLPEVEEFTASLPFDRRLFRHDIHGSIAHAQMLAKVQLITRAEAARIVRGLRQVEAEIDRGRFRFNLADEDIHLAIERRLTTIIGATGGKLHTARSRNDQVALDMRLYLHDELRAVIGLVDGLRQSLIAIAERNLETLMPGYTHLQRAQPVSLAHHVLAYVEMLTRDRERFAQARARTSISPLGAGALAGTTLPIDRAMVARLSGLSGVTSNSIDAVSDRDFVVDFLSAAALCMVHLSRMSEELILWASAEFGFVTIPEEFSTGSSMMPQKKNPDLFELIRGKSGRVIGGLVAMLTTLKALPLAYNSDLQEDKERCFDALDTLRPCLSLLAKVWPRLKFDEVRMREATGGWALATDLAEHLVRRGIPFRQAHEVVGSLVRDALASGKTLDQFTHADLQRYSKLFDLRTFNKLTAENSLRSRDLPGGPAPAAVRKRLAELKRG